MGDSCRTSGLTDFSSFVISIVSLMLSSLLVRNRVYIRFDRLLCLCRLLMPRSIMRSITRGVVCEIVRDFIWNSFVYIKLLLIMFN